MRKTVGILLVLSLTAAYWLGYQHGSVGTPDRLNVASSDRQVGLSFRQGHNDVSRFKTEGGASTAEKHLK